MKQTLTIDALNENLHSVIDFVDEQLELNGCNMKEQMQIELALEEMFVNIANYAYEGRTGKAEVIFSCDNGVAEITLSDSGKPYDPLKKADPDTTLSAEERKIGGLGIFLVKKNMDNVAYRYEDGKNIFTMSKRITK
ncbi:MAG: ATP-binding protein [Clostridia bacterium]|nr:ATP-binding protein [Clostridia bacterium]